MQETCVCCDSSVFTLMSGGYYPDDPYIGELLSIIFCGNHLAP